MNIQILARRSSGTLRPFFPVPVPAGPPTDIEQEAEWLDIDRYISDGNGETVFIRATGLSMQSRFEAGINDGDLLAVKLTGFARPGDVVVAQVNGEFTVKRLKSHSHGLYLVPANDAYPIRRVERRDDFRIWAVVSHVIHKLRRAA